MPLCNSTSKTTIIEDNSTGISLKTDKDFRLKIFQRLEDTPNDWELAQPVENQFLQRPFLSAIEKYPPSDYEFVYLIFYRNNHPVGVCYCQLLEFKTGGTIRDEADNGVWTKAVSYLRGLIVDKIKIKTLVCGNALLTGEHAFYFRGDIPEEKQYSLVTDALTAVHDYFEGKGENVSGFFLKDFGEQALTNCKTFETRGFHKVEFQPSMVMNIPQDWTSFDDYLASFTAKYRTRAKRAFKKGNEIVKREFTHKDIQSNHKRIFELYREIEANAGFSLATLNAGYFCGLKEYLGEDFTLTGYFLNDELVGFFTTILNGEEMEAHFLGFDQKLNRSHQIYLNMLYDMVRMGIDRGVKQIVFARTALEIKSSVGAVPEEMYCYTRHWNDLPNRFVPRIFSYLNPIEEWTPRSPFKTA